MRSRLFIPMFWLIIAAVAELGAASEPPYPPRNRCTDIPGHVRCIVEHGGLIHGAEITTPDFTLTCRAFRRVWLQRFAQVEAREIVVAGVCDQSDPQGNLITSWNTLDPLETNQIKRGLWASTDVPLPSSVVDVELVVGNIYTIFAGYYLPQEWDGRTSHDTSQPAGYDDFPRGGHIQVWTEEPAREKSVESPRFDDAVSQCGPGHVVCSAYLKILHPDAQSREVRVEMVSARRFFSFSPGQLKLFNYSAEFLNRKF